MEGIWRLFALGTVQSGQRCTFVNMHEHKTAAGVAEAMA